ncbi:MAG: hypothetical protein FD137_194 [Spirochaetes bacterium]|nr:MAG: hypothetical protein FD137_194 [Spirochaetota bacterium]
MKNRNRVFILLLVVFLGASLSSCDLVTNFINSRMRSIDPIQVFNSRLELTRKLAPNDTLFVQVQGLKPFTVYDVFCKDSEGKEITKLSAYSDENGVIAPSPLWYDVGFEKRDIGGGVLKPYLDTEEKLGLQAFNIQVVSKDSVDTNFALTFWVVFKTDITRPEPIVMAGKKTLTDLFYLENSFLSGEELRVKVEPATLSAPPEPISSSTPIDLYIVPYSATPILDGTDIGSLHSVYSGSFLVSDLTSPTGVALTGDWATIPVTAQGKAFSVILDVNNDGVYNLKKEGTDDFYLDGIDGNGVAGFIVVAPTPQVAVLISLNVASNGNFRWVSTEYDYGYVDDFKRDGTGTQLGWDWQYPGYGVKAIWNPYINWGGNAPNPRSASFYYGTYINLYILKADHLLADGTPLTPAPGTAMMSVPVQSSCYNGCGQQTIWRTPISADYVGNYFIFLDMNNNGEVDDFDMIDNLNSTGGTPGYGFRIIN